MGKKEKQRKRQTLNQVQVFLWSLVGSRGGTCRVNIWGLCCSSAGVKMCNPSVPTATSGGG